MEDYDEEYIDPVEKIMGKIKPIDVEEKIKRMLH